MKKCTKCKEKKSLTNFYKRHTGGGGLRACCKRCTDKKNIEYNKTDSGKLSKVKSAAKYRESEHGRAKITDISAEYRKTEHGRAMRAKVDKEFKTRYPEKALAKGKFQYYRRKHNIISPGGYNWHHWSYDIKYFNDVLLFPQWFHREIHKHMAYNQEHKCYGAKAWGLLDTKEKHMMFLTLVKSIFAGVKLKKG